MNKIKLFKLFEGYNAEIIGKKEIIARDLCYNSKKCKEGSIFFAIKGENTDGHNFINEAVENGAKAVVIENKNLQLSLGKDIVIIKVDDTKDALSYASNIFYEKPSEKLKVIGITGTNGKTTITYLLERIFSNSGVIGTINYRFGNKIKEASNTTPMAPELQKLMYEMKNEGIENVFIEVSSHGIELKRINYINFDCAVFTNLTHEHLDFHKDMESYFNAKKKLFSEILPFSSKKEKYAVINIDDKYGVKILEEIYQKINCITYSLKNSKADIYAKSFRLSLKGIEAELSVFKDSIKIKTNLIGEFNLLNILAAVGVAIALKLPLEKVSKELNKEIVIPGRLERPIENKNYFVDYAHTPDALENVLKCLNKIKGKKRIITVFGCGGDRDKEKRPIMGYVAAKLSDFVIITSDNPRNEDPFLIIEQILTGIEKAIKEGLIKDNDFRVIPDRKDAITLALRASKNSDIVLVAGKGHENYQIIGDKKNYFSDVEIIKSLGA